jgi:hypothetical protein
MAELFTIILLKLLKAFVAKWRFCLNRAAGPFNLEYGLKKEAYYENRSYIHRPYT